MDAGRPLWRGRLLGEPPDVHPSDALGPFRQRDQGKLVGALTTAERLRGCP